MKSNKELTLTKKGKFYTKVCKIYGMALRAQKELKELEYLFEDYENIPEEKEICKAMLMRLALFSDTEFLQFQQLLTTIRMEKIEENKQKIAKIREYLDRKTSNSDIF